MRSSYMCFSAGCSPTCANMGRYGDKPAGLACSSSMVVQGTAGHEDFKPCAGKTRPQVKLGSPPQLMLGAWA
jgi:hypothetical protein